MDEGTCVVGFRRVEDLRGIRRFVKGRRWYEVLLSDGSLRLVSFRDLDKLVDARRWPADFWACVHAADWQRDHLGESEEPQMISWPIGMPPRPS